MARSRRKPPKASPHLVRADQLFAQGDLAGAIHAAREGLAVRKRDPQLLGSLGVSQLAAGYIEDAIETLSAIPSVGETGRYARINLAAAYRAVGRIEEAHRELDAVLAIDSENDYALCKKGELLAVEGRLDEAEALLAPRIEGRDGVYAGLAATWGQVMLNRDEPDRAIDVVRAASEDTTQGEQGRVWPTFILAQLIEKSGRYDEAFEVFERGNAFKHMAHNPGAHTHAIDSMIDAWTPDVVAKLPEPELESGGGAVFIVGMPRSGTSLVEQVLSSLEGVFGAGEMEHIPRAARGVMQPVGSTTSDLVTAPQLLTQGVVDSLSVQVLGAMRERAGSARLVTDKNPLNVLHLGLISAILPDARIIHCVRDPIDSCLSCFCQDFGSAMSFPYNLEHLGQYYNDYRRTIAHWKEVLDTPILNVEYERLVAEPEPVMRGMVDFIGEEWDPRCLEFHTLKRAVHTASNDQVRRPLYKSSVAKWKRYERQLAPLIDAIDDRYLS